MIPSYRKFIPKLYAIIAVIAIPLIIVLSSGNTVNQSNNIINSSTIKVNALPAFSNIKIGDSNINTVNSDIKILENTATTISVEKENFLKETWDLFSPKGINTLVNLDPVYLLPAKPIEIQSEYNIKNILDFTLTVSEKDAKTYLLPYDISSFKTPIPLDVSYEKISSRPIKLDTRTFFFPNSKCVIYNLNEKYFALDLNTLLTDITYVTKINDNSLLLNNKNRDLYQYNLESKELKFITNDTYSIQTLEESNSVFVLTEQGIFKIDRGAVLTQDYFQSSKVSFRNQIEGINKTLYQSQDKNDFGIKFLNNATILKFNKNLYVNQEGIKEWKLLAKNINQFTTSDSKVFYLDENYNLMSLDVYEQQLFYVGSFKKEDSLDSKLYYSPDWNRILFYSNNIIQSLYYNKNHIPTLPSSPILYNQKNDWLLNHYCYAGIVEKSQFCIQDNKLKIYRNVNFLPTL